MIQLIDEQQLIAKLIDRVIQRLVAREHAVYITQLDQLTQGLPLSILLDYATIQVQLPSLDFIYQLAVHNANHGAVKTLLDAFAYGIKLHLVVHSQLLAAIPFRQLIGLPLIMMDHQLQHIHYHAGSVLSYQDIAALPAGWLVLDRKTKITALAQETLSHHHLHLIFQE